METDDRVIRADFVEFMAGHRLAQNADFLAVKTSFYAGWYSGYYWHQRRALYMNLMLMGVVFMALGFLIHHM